MCVVGELERARDEGCMFGLSIAARCETSYGALVPQELGRCTEVVAVRGSFRAIPRSLAAAFVSKVARSPSRIGFKLEIALPCSVLVWRLLPTGHCGLSGT